MSKKKAKASKAVPRSLRLESKKKGARKGKDRHRDQPVPSSVRSISTEDPGPGGERARVLSHRASVLYPEMYSKSPAMAVSQLLMSGGAEDLPLEDVLPRRFLLHDLAREALLDPERRLLAYKLLQKASEKPLKPYIAHYRRQLERARVIELDSEMSHWLAKVSCWHPEMMERALRMARLPYDPMWVEFDEFARQRALVELGIGGGIAEDTSHKTGYLIESAPPSSEGEQTAPVYRVTVFSDLRPAAPPAVVQLTPIGYYYSPEPGDPPFRGETCDEWINSAANRAVPPSTKDPSKPSVFSYAAMLWGNGWVRMHTPFGPKDFDTSETWSAALERAGGFEPVKRTVDTTLRISRQSAYHCPPIWHRLAYDWAHSGKYERQELRQSFDNVSGDLHYLTTLIALMNTNARHLSEETVERTGSKQVFGRNMPYYRYSKLSLKLPSVKVEKHFRRAVIGRGGWKLDHHIDVRGHWCYYSRTGRSDDERRPKWCTHGEYHSWHTDEEDSRKHWCAVCGYRRTWREYPEGKGDASRGWAHQQVVVVKDETIRPEEAIS